MKNAGRTFLCLLIALALVLGGLVYGARKGWTAKAQEITKMVDQEGGLKSILLLRATDAGNLLVVAKRHLDKEDARIQAVAEARDVLKSESSSLSQKHAANQALTDAVEALAGALKEQPSLQNDTKDWNYVISLTKALDVYLDGDAVSAYNDAAGAYNNGLRESFSGWFAMLTGVPQMQLFD